MHMEVVGEMVESVSRPWLLCQLVYLLRWRSLAPSQPSASTSGGGDFMVGAVAAAAAAAAARGEARRWGCQGRVPTWRLFGWRECEAAFPPSRPAAAGAVAPKRGHEERRSAPRDTD